LIRGCNFRMNDSSTEPEFRPLDPRAIRLWRATNLIAFGILLLALLPPAVIGIIARPGAWPWIVLAWCGLAVLGGWLSFWRPPRVYRAWGYRVDARVLETRSGLILQVSRLLPLARLQHVDLRRGPLERLYGLASLVLHTAGTHSASISIPGLDADEAVRLRDHLVEIGGDDAV
jgi:membrane protein YdbS with pleckstrin-like domain